MKIQQIRKYSIAITLLAIIGYFVLEILSSNATAYCPLSHKFDSNMMCRICDRKNAIILIEHFNIDTNKLQLSIQSENKIMWIMHPYKWMKNYDEALSHNVIKFDPIDEANLIVNGERFLIEKIK